MKVGLPVMGNVCQKSVNTKGLVAASAADHGSIKKVESRTTSFEDSGLLRENVTKIIANKTKEQRGGFLRMFLGSQCARLLGSLLSERDVILAGDEVIKASHGIKKEDFKCLFIL